MKSIRIALLVCLFAAPTFAQWARYPCGERKEVGFWDLPAELERLGICSGKANVCPGTFTSLSSYTIGGDEPYLWGGNNSHVFTIAEQNALLLYANATARDQRPDCPTGQKATIMAIDFFNDLISGDDGYFIGAHIYYGCCVLGPPRESR